MPAATTTPKRQLTLFDCVCVIVGIIIGAGIFETTEVIAIHAAFQADLARILPKPD